MHRAIAFLPVFLISTGFEVAVAQVDFAHEIVPILRSHCVTCHGGREAEGGFSINSRASIMEADVVASGKPDDSHLIDLVTSGDDDLQMPPSDRPRLSKKEVRLLSKWIAEDLPWEQGFSFATSSYEPQPREVTLPAATNGRDHPIDRLLDEYLAKNEIGTPALASDTVFLRRVHLDLVGLLPTSTQCKEFVADSSPDKRQRKIDELLAREIDYADHWLSFFNDLFRNDYSGTGFITGGRKQISTWLYAALRDNMPFDQMARELIAPSSDSSRGFIDGIKWRGTVSAGQTLPIQFRKVLPNHFWVST